MLFKTAYTNTETVFLSNTTYPDVKYKSEWNICI